DRSGRPASRGGPRVGHHAALRRQTLLRRRGDDGAARAERRGAARLVERAPPQAAVEGRGRVAPCRCTRTYGAAGAQEERETFFLFTQNRGTQPTAGFVSLPSFLLSLHTP